MASYQCLACKHVGTNGESCLACTSTMMIAAPATNATALPSKPPRQSLATAPKREFVRVCSELGNVLDGRLPRTGLVLVTGPAGAGKSTTVATTALERMRQGDRVGVLDAEMNDALARETWTRAGAQKRDLSRLIRYSGLVYKWKKALALVRKDGCNVVVVDSIHEWTTLAPTPTRVLWDIRRNGRFASECLILAIAHFSRDGHLHGTVKADHRADAVVIVEPKLLRQTKCTWAPPCEAPR